MPSFHLYTLLLLISMNGGFLTGGGGRGGGGEGAPIAKGTQRGRCRAPLALLLSIRVDRYRRRAGVASRRSHWMDGAGTQRSVTLAQSSSLLGCTLLLCTMVAMNGEPSPTPTPTALLRLRSSSQRHHWHRHSIHHLPLGMHPSFQAQSRSISIRIDCWKPLGISENPNPRDSIPALALVTSWYRRCQMGPVARA